MKLCRIDLRFSASEAHRLMIADAWRRTPAPPRVQLEPGAKSSPRLLGIVLDELSPAVDSIGFIEEEQSAILDVIGLPVPTNSFLKGT